MVMHYLNRAERTRSSSLDLKVREIIQWCLISRISDCSSTLHPLTKSKWIAVLVLKSRILAAAPVVALSRMVSGPQGDFPSLRY